MTFIARIAAFDRNAKGESPAGEEARAEPSATPLSVPIPKVAQHGSGPNPNEGLSRAVSEP